MIGSRASAVAIGSVVVMCALVGALSLTTTHLDSLELKSYDFLMAVLRGPRPTPSDLVIVAIDETSLKEFSSQFTWPWPRSVHGELIRQLNAAGARAIVFDVLFDQASDPAEDADLASAIRESKAPVVLAATSEDVEERQFHTTQQVRPLPALLDAGARVGFAIIHPDVDGALRRAPLSVGGAMSLSAAAVGASGLQVDAARIPTLGGDDPEFFVNYVGGRRAIRTVSYYQAIDAAQSLPRGTFAGQTVFVGLELAVQDRAAGATELFATPFDLTMAGVEVHANAMDTIARRAFIRRASPAVNWLGLIVSGALISIVMVARLRFRTKLGVAGALILAEPVVAGAAFVAGGYWLYTVQPLLISTGVFMLNALYQYRVSERERVYVRKALTGYVSKPVMQRILDNPAALELGGAQVDATVLFSDIVGFSGIAERMSPRDLTAALNTYFTLVGDIVMANDGMIDKYIGDAIMAVWGAPLPDDRHAAKACAAALAMKAAVASSAGSLRARIGINTGPMMAGNLGHRERMEYTVIGDAVNLSSRLEGANKLYGSSILVSDTTMAAAGDGFIFQRVDRIRVVGKQEPIDIYELLAGRSGDMRPVEARAQSFATILQAYDRHDWQGALDAAARHGATYGEADPIVRLYEERCRRFQDTPPAPDWDGVYSLTSK